MLAVLAFCLFACSSGGGSGGSLPVTGQDYPKFDQKIYDANKADVESLAKKAGAEAVTTSDQRHQEELAAFKIDSNSYSFEAKRWGDFLTIYVSRQGQKYAGSVNIGQTHEIILTEGHAPDLGGTLVYEFQEEADVKGGGSSGLCDTYYSTADSLQCAPNFQSGPGKGRHWVVTADLPSKRAKFPMFNIQQTAAYGPTITTTSATTTVLCLEGGLTTVYYNQPNSPDADTQRGNYVPNEKVKGVAEDAVDDQIDFIGLGATIYAPAGKGAEVQSAILAALDKGFVPPTPVCKP